MGIVFFSFVFLQQAKILQHWIWNRLAAGNFPTSNQGKRWLNSGCESDVYLLYLPLMSGDQTLTFGIVSGWCKSVSFLLILAFAVVRECRNLPFIYVLLTTEVSSLLRLDKLLLASRTEAERLNEEGMQVTAGSGPILTFCIRLTKPLDVLWGKQKSDQIKFRIFKNKTSLYNLCRQIKSMHWYLLVAFKLSFMNWNARYLLQMAERPESKVKCWVIRLCSAILWCKACFTLSFFPFAPVM